MRAFVTGCAGFIGSHLTESLLEDGHEVLGVDCFNDNYGRGDKLENLAHAQERGGFQFVPLDLARGELGELVAEADVVYHLAAEPGVRPSWGARFEHYVRNNLSATQHVLEAARAMETPPRVVYASSSSIYGNAETLPTVESAVPAPFSPYGVTKLAAEHLCAAYHANHGVPTVSLRYFTVYGPRQRPDMAFNKFCRAVLAGKPIDVYGDGTQTRDFTYVADIVAATRAAGERPADGVVGSVFNVGGGSRISVLDVVEMLEQASGGPVAVNHVGQQSGDVRDTGADTTAARERLGFDPQTSVRDGLLAEFDWLRARQ